MQQTTKPASNVHLLDAVDANDAEHSVQSKAPPTDRTDADVDHSMPEHAEAIKRLSKQAWRIY